MSARRPIPIPTAKPVAADDSLIPVATPLDAAGKNLIPELAGRAPTHNESVLLSGEVVSCGSTNVKEFWYHWKDQRLFVRFLNGSLYAYEAVPLSVALGMLETSSHGRYVWNKLRDVYAYKMLEQGHVRNPKPQVVRAINKP
jgi:hypothetical protein